MNYKPKVLQSFQMNSLLLFFNVLSRFFSQIINVCTGKLIYKNIYDLKLKAVDKFSFLDQRLQHDHIPLKILAWFQCSSHGVERPFLKRISTFPVTCGF